MRLFLISLIIMLLASCGEEEEKRFEFAGGTLTIALDNQPSTYIVRNVMDYYSGTVLSQICEGLVGIDPKSTKIIPKIASSWSVSEDGTKYTFQIRDNVLFHPSKAFSSENDRKLTMNDVVKTIEICCSRDQKGMPSAAYEYAFKGNLKGADAFFDGKAKSISGVKVSGNTLTLELLQEDHNFLYKLANVNTSIISYKVYKAGMETSVVGTGPFVYSAMQKGTVPKLSLLRNKDYYLKDEKGNSLPYLDEVVFVFQSMKLEQLDMFEKGQIDILLGLPTNKISEMLQTHLQDFNSTPPKYELKDNPLLETHYYFFNMMDERFKDPRVRQAFNYAINKEIIGSSILRNQYNELGKYGIVPPVPELKGYDFNLVEDASYNYNPDLARKLLAEAGYPNGKGFGDVVLKFNVDGNNSAVADEFRSQIQMVLNINVNLDGFNGENAFEQLIKAAENGNGDIFRLAWGADYPSPETFLMNFYGGYVPVDSTKPSTVNKSRYVNKQFDQLFDQARNARKKLDQMRLFSKAEAELMKDPPLIPLWYAGDIKLAHSYIRNFHFNALNSLDFTRVYKKTWTKEEYLKEFPNSK